MILNSLDHYDSWRLMIMGVVALSCRTTMCMILKSLDHHDSSHLIIMGAVAFPVQDNHAHGRALVERIPAQFLAEAHQLWLLGAKEQKTVSLFQHGVNR